jgi:hypothetical protein
VTFTMLRKTDQISQKGHLLIRLRNFGSLNLEQKTIGGHFERPGVYFQHLGHIGSLLEETERTKSKANFIATSRYKGGE